jgi:hypothetical protein
MYGTIRVSNREGICEMTKQKMAIIITTVMFNANHPVSEKDKVQWKNVKSLCRQKTETVSEAYLKAVKVLDSKKYPPEFFGLGAN